MNSEKAKPAFQAHDCILKDRGHIEITGVLEVLSFDENGVILVTPFGELSIEGSEMRVGTLDTERGVVAVDGRISALYYSDNTPKRRRGLFGRADS